VRHPNETGNPTKNIRDNSTNVERKVLSYLAYTEQNASRELSYIIAERTGRRITRVTVELAEEPTNQERLIYAHSRYAYAEAMGYDKDLWEKLSLEPIIDSRSTFTNSFQDMQRILDSEALRNFLAREIATLFDSLGIALHYSIILRLGSHMTLSGSETPMTFTGTKKLPGGPLGKATIERPLEQITAGAIYGLQDTPKDPSTAIMVGAKIEAGTGALNLTVTPPVRRPDMSVVPMYSMRAQSDTDVLQVDVAPIVAATPTQRSEENIKQLARTVAERRFVEQATLPPLEDVPRYDPTQPGIVTAFDVLPPPLDEGLGVPEAFRGIIS
jgi:hypothetical protein